MDNETVIIGDFQINSATGQGQQIAIKGFLFNKDTAKEINERIDMMQDVLKRQVARQDIITKEGQRQAMLDNLETHKKQVAEIAAERNKGRKLTSQQKQVLDNNDHSVNHAVAFIEKIDQEIEFLKKKVAIT